MQTKHLKYFVDIAELGSVSAAAKKNFISPQGLSRALSSLESDFGCKLFNRRANGMELTEYGEKLIGQAKQMVLLEKEMRKRVTHLRDASVQWERASTRVYLNNIVFDASFFRPVMEIMADTLPKGSRYYQCSNAEIVENLLETGGNKGDKLGLLCFFSTNRVENNRLIAHLREQGFTYKPYAHSYDVVLVSKNSDLAEKTALSDEDIMSHPIVCAGGDIKEAVEARFGAECIAVVTNDTKFRFDMVAKNEAISFAPAFQELVGEVPDTVTIPMKEPYFLELGFAAMPEVLELSRHSEMLRRLTTYYATYDGLSNVSLVGNVAEDLHIDAEPFRRREAVANVQDSANISPRERDVFDMLAKGMQADSISAALYISKATVKTHMNSIYKKLGIHSQTELIAIVEAEQRRLIVEEKR